MRTSRFPVIDLFAGPGGLAEGFTAYVGDGPRFDVTLSIENDLAAIKTLRLRKYFKSFNPDDVPDLYYQYVKGEIPRTRLEATPEWKNAEEKTGFYTLGAEKDRFEIHRRIAIATGSQKNFVLIGGPPCQAYSLVGRSRMTGRGKLRKKSVDEADEEYLSLLQKFHSDTRHTLYRAYLEIIAVHQPAIFVMENVKGILSAKLSLPDGTTEGTFDRILKDLQNPSAALSDEDVQLLVAQKFSIGQHRYKLFPLVRCSDSAISPDLFDPERALRAKDFVIRAENHGIPQRRHRVIVLGVRDDVLGTPRYLQPTRNATLEEAIGQLPPLRSRVSPVARDSIEAWTDTISEAAAELLKVTCVPSLDSQKYKQILTPLSERRSLPLNIGGNFIETDTKAATSELDCWYFDKRLGGTLQHETRSHMESDLKRYLFLSTVNAARSGNEARAITLEQWPAQLLPLHDNVQNSDDLSQVGFKDRFRVQSRDIPATTITSHISKDGHYFIHYDPRQCRSLTVREAARIQTFPDNYYFEGNRTEQYKQVGNAVPPLLAWKIAVIVSNLLSQFLR